MIDPSTHEIIVYLVLWLIASLFLIHTHKDINSDIK